jgi:hypothetical protein
VQSMSVVVLSRCASNGLDGAYTLPINHKTVTEKTPMTSDEENVLQKIGSGLYSKKKMD